MGDSSTSFSLGRLLSLLVPAALLVVIGGMFMRSNLESHVEQAEENMETTTISRLLGSTPAVRALSADYQDSDGDLVADAPPSQKCISPDELTLSFIASSDRANEPETWQELTEALSESLGRPVNYLQLDNIAEQLEALKEGRLHIAWYSTGTVPTAVNGYGFVPLVTFGDEKGDYGYRMKIIVAAESDIQELSQLRGRSVAFTRPWSNSGCKAALVSLMQDQDLSPERDYQWHFSYGHEESIQEVVSGDTDAASVASDVLDRVIARGELEESAVRAIHESERFPPAALGVVYNLSPELQEKIREVLINFDWNGTALESQLGSMGAKRFVSVSYKDDWANIRRVDQSAETARAALQTVR